MSATTTTTTPVTAGLTFDEANALNNRFENLISVVRTAKIAVQNTPDASEEELAAIADTLRVAVDDLDALKKEIWKVFMSVKAGAS